MPYLIIAALIVVILGWAVYMSKTKSGANRANKFVQPQWHGPVRRFSRGGRPIVQSDEQRTELIVQNRERYDPSIDRLDPRNAQYKGPNGAASSEQ